MRSSLLAFVVERERAENALVHARQPGRFTAAIERLLYAAAARLPAKAARINAKTARINAETT